MVWSVVKAKSAVCRRDSARPHSFCRRSTRWGQGWRRCYINPVNMPDSIRKQFGYGHYGQRTARIGPDRNARSNFSHPIRFRSSKEGPDHTVQNWPGFDLDGLVLFWPKKSTTTQTQCADALGYTHTHTHTHARAVNHLKRTLFQWNNPFCRSHFKPIYWKDVSSSLHFL